MIWSSKQTRNPPTASTHNNCVLCVSICSPYRPRSNWRLLIVDRRPPAIAARFQSSDTCPAAVRDAPHGSRPCRQPSSLHVAPAGPPRGVEQSRASRSAALSHRPILLAEPARATPPGAVPFRLPGGSSALRFDRFGDFHRTLSGGRFGGEALGPLDSPAASEKRPCWAAFWASCIELAICSSILPDSPKRCLRCSFASSRWLPPLGPPPGSGVPRPASRPPSAHAACRSPRPDRPSVPQPRDPASRPPSRRAGIVRPPASPSSRPLP